jgi:uncharacterized membrane protein YeiH
MNWQLQPVLEHFGITVAAITGVLAGRHKRIDLFGVLVLALVTAFGGGTVRDVLAGDLPPVWIRSSDYLLNASLTAAIMFFLLRARSLPGRLLLIADAGALALFTLIGVRKGMTLQFTPPIAIMLGVITGVAGGIIRDVLIGEVPLVFRREIHLYATAALGGAILYVVLHRLGMTEVVATAVAALTTLSLRLAGIRWKIGLPAMEPEIPKT